MSGKLGQEPRSNWSALNLRTSAARSVAMNPVAVGVTRYALAFTFNARGSRSARELPVLNTFAVIVTK